MRPHCAILAMAKPSEAFNIFFFAGYFYFARLVLETVRKLSFKACIKWTYLRLFFPRKVIFALLLCGALTEVKFDF